MASTVHRFLMDREWDGSRLDQVLTALLPEHSRSFLSSLIADGRVAISGRTVTRKSERVEAGTEVTIEIPPPASTDVIAQDIPLTILYQDADLVVIDKPAGLVVHPAAGHADSTLVNALLHHVSDLSGIGGEIRPGIVHRLDKDTSGVLLVAKNDAAHRALSAAWNSGAVRKTYLTLVYGAPKTPEGVIEGAIGRDPRDRKKMAVVSRGRPARTLYTTLEAFRYVSLLSCRLETGRTHQLRVHLKSIGHPILGDPTYSGPQWRGIPDKRLQKAIAAMTRQALHASSLELDHPTTGERMKFEAPLPADFEALLEAVRGEAGSQKAEEKTRQKAEGRRQK
ncbi:MAG: RluA family pseudouridine synthase [Thermoanaerobaculia bacterium]